MIEHCAGELEDTQSILECIFWWHLDLWKKQNGKRMNYSAGISLDFAANKVDRKFRDQYVDKIRSCDNWEELYDEFHHTSRFYRDMKSGIEKELKHCRKV